MNHEENNSKKEQDEQLREMNYAESEDIFQQEKPLSLDENGEPIENENEYDNYEMEMNLDVPGSNQDNAEEILGSEDEENNYYSLSDQDDHEEENEDLED